MDATIAGSIVGALIGALGAIIVAAINFKAQNKKFMTEMEKQNAQFIAEMEKQNALIVYRLEQLEQKVSQHNHFDSRLVALEEQVKTLFNRVA